MRVILTHENTDFDGWAAQLAASKLYSDAIPVLSRKLNREVRDFMGLYGDQLPYVSADELPRRRIEEAIIVDSQTVPSLRGIDASTSLRFIDHHPLRGQGRTGASYSLDDVGAVTTLIVEQLRELRSCLTPLEATALLLGIYEDTGSLSYSIVTPRDLRGAAWLLEQGANLSTADRFLRHPLDERYQTIYSQLVQHAEWQYVEDNAVLLTTAMLQEDLEELSTLAHKLDEVFDPDASFFAFAFKDQLEVIARSSSKAVDVGEILRDLGGGGHSTAAAAFVQGASLEQVRERLVSSLRKHVRPAVTVRQIMSFGVHTLSSNMLLVDAETLMRRYGHEGFPVVDNGKLVGVLTRRDLDRALHHRLTKATVRSYMHKGDVAVSPSDSVALVQRVMSDHGIGQVPVVEDGNLLGIVTRTDLIKLWSNHVCPSRNTEIQARLQEMLPPSLLDLLIRARDVANQMGFSLYIVGGFVRDLLLGIPTLDLDLVVEGDAIALASELGRRLSVRVRSHNRFGTAKVMLEGISGKDLPSTLDFVTARTEFYQHPTALPQVERSSIKQDLYRRDFTINTMAICLDRDRYGELLDFYGGEKDLKDRLIRVLHNLSFVEDPTRILRAVRLEQRLGFGIEPRTAELIFDALALLERISGERLRHELELILDEKVPGAAVRRLAELGVLTGIEPGLRYDQWLEDKVRQVVSQPGPEKRSGGELDDAERNASMSIAAEKRYLLLAQITYRLSKLQLERLLTRLRFNLDVARYLRQVRDLHALTWRLDKPKLALSRVHRLLSAYSPRAILAYSIALDAPAARKNALRYLYELRWVRTEIGGEYLKRRNVPPGPAYGEILEKVLEARLDGRVKSRTGEEKLVEDLLAARARIETGTAP